MPNRPIVEPSGPSATHGELVSHGEPGSTGSSGSSVPLGSSSRGEAGVESGPADDGSSGPARSARREATRQRVLDAAREVFAERGVFGATVEDICEHAGFTRGAFYSNFADRDEVVLALMDREQARLLAHLDASFALVDREVAEASDLGSALSSIVDQILRSIPVDRQLALVQTELEIHAVRRPELSGPFLAASARFRDRIGAFIVEAMGRHDRHLLADALDVTDAAIAIVERSFRRSLLQGPGADPDAMARAILPALLLALSERDASPADARAGRPGRGRPGQGRLAG